MKTIRFFILILLIGLFACDKSDNNKTTLLKNYNESYVKWTKLKAQNGNSYTYQTTFGSWTGGGSTTELKIENGKVTGRNYHRFILNGSNGKKDTVASYVETVGDLGSHESGAKLLTIDELYRSCIGEYLVVDEDNNQLFFESNTEGVMYLCGFVPDGCVDDCFNGITIENLKWIK
ncbi:hypothetical protein [Solitalea canadensis]|uniref:Lipocalin-like domain-containing protein n=1 Tax=Solitalea canadensis (strain ATCC 29591 / DSM 3403 / JCM 21819 / LMG 8368 / NBRC 15130 / NCIMB 12057 / USAM 9D) TaxID=929556 RepID=H8KMZ3_SOLCM|nr:hypothetical protein [Solitalea canadensis]AFD09072.1 hypothetical protein Solca_4082 [Solitalea canadensis DSM 3403]